VRKVSIPEEAFDLEVKPVTLDSLDLHSQPTSNSAEDVKPCHEKCIEGPLTYFRYYFEDDHPADISVSTPTRRWIHPKLIVIGLAGVGVAIAAFAAGVAFAKTIHHTPPDKVSDASLKSMRSPSSVTHAKNSSC
jgi:hypothetical protein